MRSVRLAPVDLQSIKLDIPLPFSLVDSRGVLLARKGFVFTTEKKLDDLANHGNGFFVNFSDLSDPQVRRAGKAYANQLLEKLRLQNPPDALSKVHIRYGNTLAAEDIEDRLPDWRNMVEICNAMLHTRDAQFFHQRLESVSVILNHQLRVNPDESLMALFYLSEKETYLYSATHCMLVCVMCVLTASTILRWPDADVDLLMRCALTMNLGMVDLQDDLVLQPGPVDLSQKFLIDNHPDLSSKILELFGVKDPQWLTVVREHHKKIQYPLQSEQLSDRLIGLLQRADVFSAKLAARVSREPQHSSIAMMSIYFDAQSQLDVMGAAIIKAVGIYRPGSFVKLASGEVAVVLRRSDNTATPTVAVVLNREGIPVVAQVIRNSADKRYAVISSVPSASVQVTLNLEKLLKLSRQQA